MKMNENGRSMVEMLGVLAIIGVLSAGGLAGYSKAMFKHKLNSTMDQITMLVTNIRTMYGTQGNYSGFSAASAVDLGIVPAVMIASDTGTGNDRAVSLTNPFKGDVTFALIDATTGNSASGDSATGFTLTYSGLPAEACISLSTADFGSGAGSGYIGVNANSKGATASHVGTGEGTSYDMSTAITNCQGNEDSTITWYFY
jgi:type II secretory pathway pseudopilin PulG